MREYRLNEWLYYGAETDDIDNDSERRCNTMKMVLEKIMKETCTQKQLEIVEMALEGKRQTEIAQILNINKSTVSKTYRRGINNIRKRAKYIELFICSK